MPPDFLGHDSMVSCRRFPHRQLGRVSEILGTRSLPFSCKVSRMCRPQTVHSLLIRVTDRNIIILSVTCPMHPVTWVPEPQWQFLNLQRQPLTGRGARSVNFQEFFQYVPVFYLGPLRDADDEFSAQSQFWGRLLKAMHIPDALQAKLKSDLDLLNKDLLAADPRLKTITDNIKRIVQILPADTPGDLQLRALPLLEARANELNVN